MLKQSSSVQCVCGQAMTFPEGEIKAQCSCGAIWECGSEGYWYPKTPITSFVPILANLNPKARPNRYDKYMERRNKGRERRKGKR